MQIQSLVALVVGALAVFASGAQAGDVSDVGPTTQRALELQRSGQQAAPVRPMLKDVAYRTYERYLESFTYPIPEQFERDGSFSPDGG